MAVEVTLGSIIPAPVPTDGWKVRYRVKGTAGAYIVPSGSPFMAQPIVFTTTDPPGTLYEGFIRADCGALESIDFAWVTPCECAATYSPAASGAYCEKQDTTAATTTNSGYCLAASVNTAYTNYESRIYTVGFTTATLNLPPGTLLAPFVYGRMTNTPQWANPLATTIAGPLNREGVWIDNDCDGSKDSLPLGTQTTIAFIYNNLGGTRTMYLGVGADNQFQVKLNGVLIADSGTGGDRQFKIWHIIPVTVLSGINYFNMVGTGDGSPSDSLGMVLYDNTAAQLLVSTSDAGLSIAFKSSTLRGTTFDVATCPSGYSLDTSGGSGDYICVRTLTDICNPAP